MPEIVQEFVDFVMCMCTTLLSSKKNCQEIYFSFDVVDCLKIERKRAMKTYVGTRLKELSHSFSEFYAYGLGS